MEPPILLSIVIPTKNRYFYLKSLLELIDSFHSEDIETVIQDNSDNNEEILNYLRDNSLSNTKYFYNSENDIEKRWCSKLPDFWCADTIWPQSGIEAFSAMKTELKLSYDMVLARFVFNHPSYWNDCSYLISNKFKFSFPNWEYYNMDVAIGAAKDLCLMI